MHAHIHTCCRPKLRRILCVFLLFLFFNFNFSIWRVGFSSAGVLLTLRLAMKDPLWSDTRSFVISPPSEGAPYLMKIISPATRACARWSGCLLPTSPASSPQGQHFVPPRDALEGACINLDLRSMTSTL